MNEAVRRRGQLVLAIADRTWAAAHPPKPRKPAPVRVKCETERLKVPVIKITPNNIALAQALARTPRLGQQLHALSAQTGIEVGHIRRTMQRWASMGVVAVHLPHYRPTRVGLRVLAGLIQRAGVADYYPKG